MGIDNALIFNHDMQYSNGNELMKKLNARTGLHVVNVIMGNNCNYIQNIPDDFVGLMAGTDNLLNLDQYIQEKKLIEFSNKTSEKWIGSFYINPSVMAN